MPVDPKELDLATLAFVAGSTANDWLLTRIRASGHPHLRHAHGFVFQHLLEGSPTVGELGTALGVTQQAASKSTRELEDLGYVRRRADADDRRVTRLELTEAGLDAVVVARRHRAELDARLSADLGPRAANQARKALGVLLQVTGGEAVVRSRALRPIVD